MERLGLEEGEAIEHRMVTRAIENAQKKVEARNFDTRKHLLDYDNVMNQQRKTYYGKRREALARDDIHDEVVEIVEGVLFEHVAQFFGEKGAPGDEEQAALAASLERQFGVAFDPSKPPLAGAHSRDALGAALLEKLTAVLDEKRERCDALAAQHQELGYPSWARFERDVLLQVGDRQWKDHLHGMDGLREGVSLRGYAQKDPKLEYQREGFALFEQMNARVDREVAEILFKLVLPEPEHLRPAPPPPPRPAARPVAAASPQPASPPAQRAGLPGGAPPQRAVSKAAPNDPCPCGSGKKYKKCHGA
jgi:preprotein translocase subunit SecA